MGIARGETTGNLPQVGNTSEWKLINTMSAVVLPQKGIYMEQVGPQLHQIINLLVKQFTN